MITITAEQIERVNLILSGVPGGIEKALSSAIRRANNTVRSETLKGITTVYAITRQNVRRKRQSRSAHSPATAELLELSCLRATRYRYTASTYRRQFLSNGLPCRRRCLLETGARRFKTRSLRECKADIQVCSSATVQALPISEFIGTVYGTDGGKQYRSCDVEEKAQEVINKRVEHEITRILNGYGG